MQAKTEDAVPDSQPSELAQPQSSKELLLRFVETLPEDKVKKFEELAGVPIFTPIMQVMAQITMEIDAIQKNLPEVVQENTRIAIEKARKQEFERIRQAQTNTDASPNPTRGGITLDTIGQLGQLAKDLGLTGEQQNTLSQQMYDFTSAVFKSATDRVLNPPKSILEETLERRMADKIAKNVVDVTE